MNSPTVSPPKKPTQRPLRDNEAYLTEPPDGMWFEPRPGKNKPFLARWRATDGTKESKSFLSAADRSTFAATWLKQRSEFGKAAKHVDQERVTMWEEFRIIVGDAHPLTVAREWRDWRGSASSLTVQQAWDSFNADQELRKLSPDTHSHRRLHGARLCAWLKGKAAASVRTEMLDEWLASMVDASPKTKRHHLKTARHLFEWLKERRKVPHNPADAVTAPDASEFDEEGQPVHHEINILTVEETAQLFAENKDSVCIGRLALEAFGGLRYTSAARLQRADIRWDDKGIVMPGHQHKSGQRHYVDGWPDNLWQWVKRSPEACWGLTRRQYADAKRDAFVRAKVARTHNALRHSFATYHLAAFKDAKLTAYLMTKTSLQSLNNDYRGRATKAQGDAFFSIVP